MGKTKIKDLCLYVISGGTPLTSRGDFYIGGTIPWLKTTEVHKEFIYEADNFITEAGLQNFSETYSRELSNCCNVW